MEIGSSYTWNLAHRDLFGSKAFYDANPDTPYVFVFDGTSDYGKLAEIFLENDQLGSDGVVRWAGVSLNSRKIILDLTRTPSDRGRLYWSDWTNIDIPLIPVAGANHNQILSEPPDGLPELVLQAMKVDSAGKLTEFYKAAAGTDVVQKGQARLDADPWQQFVVHAVDERGNAIDDYSIEILVRDTDGKDTSIPAFENAVHPYTLDHSFRCFHVRLNDVPRGKFGVNGNKVIARVSASTGTGWWVTRDLGTRSAPSAQPSTRSISISLSTLSTLIRNCFSRSQRR